MKRGKFVFTEKEHDSDVSEALLLLKMMFTIFGSASLRAISVWCGFKNPFVTKLCLLPANDACLCQESGHVRITGSWEQVGLTGFGPEGLLHRYNKGNERSHQKLSSVVDGKHEAQSFWGYSLVQI